MKRPVLAATLVLVLILVLSPARASGPLRTVIGSVIKVSDGDTVQVLTPEKTRLKIRLYGIDAPEIEHRNPYTGRVEKPGQPFGRDARSYLASLIWSRTVRLDVMDIDPHRRMVSLVWLGNRNINLEMIKAGMAEAYPEYLKDHRCRRQFLNAEREAKAREIGIWSKSGGYERPRDFKRRIGSGTD